MDTYRKTMMDGSTKNRDEVAIKTIIGRTRTLRVSSFFELRRRHGSERLSIQTGEVVRFLMRNQSIGSIGEIAC